MTDAAAPEARTPAGGPPRRASVLDAWRARVLQTTLTTTAVVVAVAYVPGVTAAVAEGLWSVVVLDTAMWLLVVALALGRGLPFGVRAGTFTTLLFAFSSALLWLLGPVGAGIAWLLAVPVFATLFFGVRGAIAAVLAMVAVAVAFAGLLIVGAADPSGDVPGPAYDLLAWLASAGSVVFLAVLLSAAIVRVMGGLARSTDELRRANERLAQTLHERERLEAELVRSAKARVMGTLASGIAHDLNNLLVPMLVAGSLARDATPGGSPQRRQLDLVVGAAERARDLSRRILAFSRDDRVERSPVALGPIVEQAIALLRSAGPATVVFRLELRATDVRVSADPTELHQVVMNLCTNSARALSATGGTVVVGTCSVPGAAAVELEVRDDGPGIPADLVDRVFDPYVTSQRAGEGTGLGLAIVRHVVDSLEGTVELRSAEGVGTVVTVRLPTAAPDVEATPPRFGVGDLLADPTTDLAADPAARSRRTRTVLLVDDDALVRSGTRLLLEELGYGVHEVATPADAVSLVQAAPGAVDAVITDLAMPGMSGLAVATHLRTIREDLPVLLASGFLDQDAREAAAAAGIDHVLQKPFDARTVRAALDDVFGAAVQHHEFGGRG